MESLSDLFSLVPQLATSCSQGNGGNEKAQSLLHESVTASKSCKMSSICVLPEALKHKGVVDETCSCQLLCYSVAH